MDLIISCHEHLIIPLALDLKNLCTYIPNDGSERPELSADQSEDFIHRDSSARVQIEYDTLLALVLKGEDKVTRFPLPNIDEWMVQ